MKWNVTPMHVAMVMAMSCLCMGAAQANEFLADAHKGRGIRCASCHVNGLTVTDSQREIDQQCVACHGGLEKLAGNKPAPNAHKSHLGEIGCTSCHNGHVRSQAYCSSCHDFPSMKIPYGGQAKAVAKKPLKDFQNAVPEREETVDMVIVGSGAAGFVAAIEAYEKGVRNIVILEKQPVPGGNSQLAAGGMNAAGSSVQKAKGIEDTPEQMAKDTLKGGKNTNNPDLVKVLAEESAASIEWLRRHGAPLENVARGAGATHARMHGPKGGAAVGPYLSAFFRTQVEKLDGLDLRLNSRMVRLEKNEKGEVTGVLVEGKHSGLYRLNAKAVVLATGGLGANNELVRSYRPDISPTTKTSNQPGTTGDGMVLAKDIGAKLVDMKEIQLNPTLLVGSPVIISETVRGAGAVFVNRDGKRFIQELATRDVTSEAVSKQPGGTAFEIFDDTVRQKVGQLKAAFVLGKAIEADSLEELGQKAGIDSKNLAATIARYNEFVKAGKDADFGRVDMPQAVTGPKFYAIEITPAIHYAMGGVAIDTKARVLNEKGEVIPGLYAAGEVTGGVHGKNRLGGNSISETISFGRIAGDQAAMQILGK